MNLERAPAIRTRRKAHASELDEARAIKFAAWLWRNTPITIPVVTGGKYVGTVRGNRETGESVFTPAMYAMPIGTSYDAITAGNILRRQSRFRWEKRFGAGVAGNWYDLHVTTGDPQPGTYAGTARAAVSYTRASAGAMRIGAAVSPKLRYLKRGSVFNSATAMVATCLVDRVLMYNACTMTASLQAMSNAVTATRWITTGDRGMQIWAAADAVHNATTSNLNALVYTNESGSGSRNALTTPTLTKIVSLAAPSATLGARQLFYNGVNATRGREDPFLPLQAGDLGIRQIDSYTFSSTPTGTVSFAAMVPIALCPDVHAGGNAGDYEYLHGHEAAAQFRVYDDACLSLLAFRFTAVDVNLSGYGAFGWTS